METTDWNVTDHLDSDATILAYFEAVFEDGDPTLIATALADVAKARGIADPPVPRHDIALGSIIQSLKALDLELTAKTA